MPANKVATNCVFIVHFNRNWKLLRAQRKFKLKPGQRGIVIENGRERELSRSSRRSIHYAGHVQSAKSSSGRNRTRQMAVAAAAAATGWRNQLQLWLRFRQWTLPQALASKRFRQTGRGEPERRVWNDIRSVQSKRSTFVHSDGNVADAVVVVVVKLLLLLKTKANRTSEREK